MTDEGLTRELEIKAEEWREQSRRMEDSRHSDAALAWNLCAIEIEELIDDE